MSDRSGASIASFPGDPVGPARAAGVEMAAVALAMELKLPVDTVPTIVRHMRAAAVGVARDPDESLTPEQVAAELKVSADVVGDLCRAGRLPADNVGTGRNLYLRIRRRDLESLRWEPAPSPAPRRPPPRRPPPRSPAPPPPPARPFRELV